MSFYRKKIPVVFLRGFLGVDEMTMLLARASWTREDVPVSGRCYGLKMSRLAILSRGRNRYIFSFPDRLISVKSDLSYLLARKLTVASSRLPLVTVSEQKWKIGSSKYCFVCGKQNFEFEWSSIQKVSLMNFLTFQKADWCGTQHNRGQSFALFQVVFFLCVCV